MITSRRWQDWVSGVIGALVIVSPLVFTARWTEPAAWAAYILGGLILVVAVVTLIWPDTTFPEWVQVVLAAVLFFSPWLIGFTAVTGMAWTAWIGAVAMVLVVGSTFSGRQVITPTT